MRKLTLAVLLLACVFLVSAAPALASPLSFTLGLDWWMPGVQGADETVATVHTVEELNLPFFGPSASGGTDDGFELDPILVTSSTPLTIDVAPTGSQVGTMFTAGTVVLSVACNLDPESALSLGYWSLGMSGSIEELVEGGTISWYEPESTEEPVEEDGDKFRLVEMWGKPWLNYAEIAAWIIEEMTWCPYPSDLANNMIVSGHDDMSLSVLDLDYERNLGSGISWQVVGAAGVRRAVYSEDMGSSLDMPWDFGEPIVDALGVRNGYYLDPLTGTLSFFSDGTASATLWGPRVALAGRAWLSRSLALDASLAQSVLFGSVTREGSFGGQLFVEPVYYYQEDGDGEDEPCLIPIVLDEFQQVGNAVVPVTDIDLSLNCAVTGNLELSVGYKASMWFNVPVAPTPTLEGDPFALVDGLCEFLWCEGFPSPFDIPYLSWDGGRTKNLLFSGWKVGLTYRF